MPTAVLRAEVIICSGSASFEVRRYLTTAAGKALFSYRHAHPCVCRYCYDGTHPARLLSHARTPDLPKPITTAAPPRRESARRGLDPIPRQTGRTRPCKKP